MADIKFEMILRMPFLKISNADVSFDEGTLLWKSYTTNKALPTIEQVQIVDPKEFVITALDVDSETFVVYVAIRKHEEMVMDLARKAQIEAQYETQAQVGALLFDEAPTAVSAE